MKQSWIIIILLSVTLSFSGTIALAAPWWPSVPSDLCEYMDPFADLPALPEEEILYGDTNGDGVVNVLDIIAIDLGIC
ncbi:MAG TPA: hypothetical protein PKH94_04280 [Bacteroidales bacterium]|nr:hypothetical protein [Bacteroidales bacterium]HNS46434.1 hypothetical protein [Bacteroidales bacterium]